MVAAVALGSAALALTVAYFFFDQRPATIQAATPTVVETKMVAVEMPPREVVKEAPPAADTLAVLPFEMQFEPTPAFRHEIEKINAALLPMLSGAGKLRVKPMTETAPLRYSRDPVAAARNLKVRAVLVVQFTTEPAQKISTCHLELIDVVNGFLLWGKDIEAPGGFLKNPERLAEISQSIMENVPKCMVPQQ